MTTDVGDVYSTGFEVKSSGILTTPASNVCTITLPDGTIATPTLTVTGVGLLRLDYATTQEGLHRGRVVTTTPTESQPFQFDVGPAYSTGIVSLADVRARLNMLSTTDDEEVRGYIDAATDFIEGYIGPVVRRSITDIGVTPDSDGVLWLSGPIISLTSMTAAYGSGATYTVGNYTVNGTRVVPNYGYSTVAYPVTVTYVGGRVIVPSLIRQAALDYIKWSWESQRGAAALPITGGEFEVATPATVPLKITRALDRYVPAGVA